ncbi:hypothetical protein [Candidatus Clostridium stratigraminis]|uniref:Uridine phosphorylase n=1 Tax=Candidatus Clostridium stratigraminis TaxID=3381661 RepID=A0ABW8T985_9CLOT
MKLIDNFKFELPSICLITDDPYRVKMIAAHYLDKVEMFSEIRGQVGLKGEFNGIPLTVMSVGIGITSTMAYVTELYLRNPIKRIVYLGDCITSDPSLTVGTITYINKAFENTQCYYASKKLQQYTKIIKKKNNIIAKECITATNDNYFIEKRYTATQEANVLDFTTSALYKLNNNDADIEIISILNVCENFATSEILDEAVRQSGCHSAVLLALNTVIYNA